MTKGKCLVPRHSVAWIAAAALLLTGCKNDYDFVGSGEGAKEDKDAVAFSTVVSSSRQASRADNTIVMKGQTMLLPTATSGRKVGIFAAYTGQYSWSALVRLYDTSFADRATLPAELATIKALDTEAAYNTKKDELLNEFYSSQQMYNVPATIGADGSLTYTPLQFWPNNVLSSDPTQHEYMTFWAYYPYNETSVLGEYGISMTNDEMGAGKGMGRVKFVMHPDAASQNDFLISAPVTDCNRDKYPLLRTDDTPTYDPKPVQFRLYHMLAQVRFYVFINGNDKMVYEADVATAEDLTRDDSNVKQRDLDEDGDNEPAIMNDLGEWVELHVGDKIPDESKCVRWERSSVYNLNHTSRRPEIIYTMELNNIKTTAIFHPQYHYPLSDAVNIAVEPPTTLGSATIEHYIMNPYWFTFKDGLRERLNDNYMFGYYEDTPVAKGYNATTTTTLAAAATAAGDETTYADYDGWDWSSLTTDPLDYHRTESEWDELAGIGDNASKHYNFARGNILMVVPQTLSDDDVPHVIITAHGYQVDNTNTRKTDGAGNDIPLTAKVTVNMLKMGISWESGYIYCYAFLDELHPGDDKVRGPESITVLFNKDWYTDQW